MSFVGGKLNLKGGDVKKKKKKKQAEQRQLDSAPKESEEGVVLDRPAENADRRTTAQKKYDEVTAQREAEKTKKLAQKSHRERVNEFNAYLATLTEHHDIPKVGPG